MTQVVLRKRKPSLLPIRDDDFREDLRHILNKHGIDAAVDMSDDLLAECLVDVILLLAKLRRETTVCVK